MSKLAVRAFSLAAAFAVVNLLAIGLWAAHRRAGLRASAAADAAADADAVLDFCTTQAVLTLRYDLNVRMRLEDLVKERGMVGVIVLDQDNRFVARAGDLPPPVMGAAFGDAGVMSGAAPVPPPRTVTVGDRILFRRERGGLVAVAVADVAAMDRAWGAVRTRALLAALAAVGFAPIFGWLAARLLAARRSAGAGAAPPAA